MPADFVPSPALRRVAALVDGPVLVVVAGRDLPSGEPSVTTEGAFVLCPSDLTVQLPTRFHAAWIDTSVAAAPP